MDTHRLKFLLQQIHIKGDVICFDELYYYKEKFLIKYMSGLYRYVSDKTLWSVKDFTQEVWLNVWLLINKEYVNINSETELDNFLRGITNDTIIEINKK